MGKIIIQPCRFKVKRLISTHMKRTDIPNFAKMGGLVPAIAQDAASGEVLMLAFMNEAAWVETLKTGEAHYYSRSRNQLWHKGGTSGHVQRVKDIYLDCDNDTVLLKVEQAGGAACHTGYRSCFYRRRRGSGWEVVGAPIFDPKEVYGGG
jgi:phosphoribosyl-AMP cyclohydrolase